MAFYDPGVVRLAGAVLAAGAGSRMGTPKAEVLVGGVRLVDRAVSVLADAGCAPVLAVVRAGTAVPRADHMVVNPDPASGMRSSLTLAVDAAAAAHAGALAVLLVDLPGIGADAVREVLRRWRPGRIAVGRYGSRSGHPIVIDVGLWRAALGLAEPDEGARRLLATRADLVDEVRVDADGSDLDTPADLAAWRAAHP